MTEQMQAIWLEDNQLSLRELPLPRPPSGEALVRVRLAGICATDLELVKGYYPYTGVLGHEFVGVIAAAEGYPERVGQRVVGEINARCGICPACRAGRRNHCENRTVLGIVNRHGCFAHYLSLPLENLIPVPDSIPDEQAVFTEPLAAAMQITQQLAIRPEEHVLLVGAGRLGQLIAQVLVGTGCDLRVVARYPDQRIRLESSGVRWIDESQVNVGGSDIVVEATGSQGGFRIARRAVRPGGTIVLKSTYKGRLEIDFSSIVVDEITLIGSRCGPFEAALRMLESGNACPEGLIIARYPLKAGLDAFAHAARPGIMKVLLDIEPS
jgi:threonine dehydrogenase-like Zn-dependent dehydrogenase